MTDFDNTGASLNRALSNLAINTDGNPSAEVASADFTNNRVTQAIRHGDGTTVFHQGGALHATVQSDGGDVFEDIRHPIHKHALTMAQMDNDSIVTVRGSSMTLAQALAAGFVHRRPDGSYTHGDPNASARQESRQAQQEAEQHPDLQLEGFTGAAGAAAEAALTAVVDGTTGYTQVQAIGEVVETGEISDRTLGTLASELRCEPHQVAAKLAPVRAAFEAQARQAIAASGLEADDVLAWAYEERADEMRAATKQQLMNRSTAAYRELAKAYVAELHSYDPAAILEAQAGPGLKIGQDHNGRIIVTTTADGRTYTYASAIQAGIITVRRA